MSYAMNPHHPCLPLSGSLADKAKAGEGGGGPDDSGGGVDTFFQDDDAGAGAGGSTSYWPVVVAVSVLALGGAWALRKDRTR